MPGGVGAEVVEDLHDAPPVGHHRGQRRREVDEHGVPPAAAQERVPRAVDQGRQLRGFGGHRERARVDASRIEQVADEAAHVVGLVGDDPEELAHLRRVQVRRGLQQRGGRTLDGGQRRAQLVADHTEEVGPQPLELLDGLAGERPGRRLLTGVVGGLADAGGLRAGRRAVPGLVRGPGPNPCLPTVDPRHFRINDLR